MGFFTIWTCIFCFCFRISAFFIIIFNSFSNKGIFNKWYSFFFIYRVISWVLFLLISFVYPEFFLYYLIEKAKTPFFVTDANLLAFHLFQNILFFSWIFYFPCFFYSFFFLLKQIFIKQEYSFCIRICFAVIYLHFLAITVTHFDIFYFFQNYFNSNIGSWFERADYSSHLTLYRGTFFDVWFSFLFMWIYYLFIIDFGFKLDSRRYTFDECLSAIKGFSKSFWSVFTFFWIFRSFIYLIVFYFFTGEGFLNDFIVFFFTILFCELVIIFIRTRRALSSWKDLIVSV